MLEPVLYKRRPPPRRNEGLVLVSPVRRLRDEGISGPTPEGVADGDAFADLESAPGFPGEAGAGGLLHLLEIEAGLVGERLCAVLLCHESGPRKDGTVRRVEGTEEPPARSQEQCSKQNVHRIHFKLPKSGTWPDVKA